MITLELTEEIFARFKALGIRDDEVAFLFATGTNKIQRFKMEMDWGIFNHSMDEVIERKVVQRRVGK